MEDSDEEDNHPRAHWPPQPSLRVFNAWIHRVDSDLRIRLRDALGEFDPDNEYLGEVINGDFSYERTLPLNQTARDALLSSRIRILKRLWRISRDSLTMRTAEFNVLLEQLQEKQTRINSLQNMITAIEGNQIYADDTNTRLCAQIEQLQEQLSTENSHIEQTSCEIENMMNCNENLVAENLHMVSLIQKEKEVVEKLQADNWYKAILQELRDYAFRAVGYLLFDEIPRI